MMRDTDSSRVLVVLPPGVVVSAPKGELSCSPSGGLFSGYHYSFWDAESVGNVRARYAVIPYPDCAKGHPDGWTDAMAAERWILHEVRESMLSPDSSAWFDSERYEGDDKCQTLVFTQYAPAGAPYYNVYFDFGLQEEWSNSVHGCVP